MTETCLITSSMVSNLIGEETFVCEIEIEDEQRVISMNHRGKWKKK